MTARIEAWVPSLWMSHSSKCSSGPAFIRISGGWMIGPAFISAPSRASRIGSTEGNARAMTPSARIRPRAGMDPVGRRVARTLIATSAAPCLRHSQGRVPVSAQSIAASLPASRTALSSRYEPKLPGGRNTTCPSERSGASAGKSPACAIAGSGMTMSSAPSTASLRSVHALAMATGRVPLASFRSIVPVSSTGASAVASRRQKRTTWPASDRSPAAA